MGRLDEVFVGARKSPTWAFLIGLLIVQGSLTNACQVGCSGRDVGKFSFQPGHVYNYEFYSNIVVGVKSEKNQETTVKVTGEAQLFSEGNCGYTLKLNRVTVSSNDEEYEYQQDLDKPVKFALTNGELDSQMCADPNDSEFSLNIKRALVSMFQSSGNKYETDVFGRCPTAYSTTKAGDSEVVTKLRSLGRCSYRENLSNGFVYNVVNDKSGVKSLPLLYGDYRKDQSVKDGVIETVELYETYKFDPVANPDATVRAKVMTGLKLNHVSGGGAPQFNGVSKTVIFTKPEHPVGSYQETLRDTFKRIVNELSSHVGPNAAGQFVKLVRLMRQANFNDFSRLFAEVANGQLHPQTDLAKRVYLDALFRTGTGDSVRAVIKLLRERKLSGAEEKLAYLSFNLPMKMTREALDDAAKLLDTNPPDVAYLSIGNLVNVYCKKNGCSDSDVEAISKKFLSKLNKCTFKNAKEQETVLYILKGIRNTHKLASTTADALVQCTTAKNPTRVRVAALQAFSAASCQKSLQNNAWNILKNRNEDSELRIEGYLSLTKCPNANMANQIAELLNTETVYQVGTFITTHLQNIRTSTDASREAARYYLGNIKPTKKFPFDMRRFSFNHEDSYKFDTLGLSASDDTNVIFSQNSFLPRSVRFNFTGEMFGYNFNLLEVSARQENLETLLEYYFGPRGFFNTKDSQDLLTENLRQKRSPSDYRRRRSFKGELEAITKRVKLPKDQSNDLIFDFSMKMFGNEMFFLSLGDDIVVNHDELKTRTEETTKSFKDNLRDFAQTYQFHTLFLDSEITYPTGIGFPLELSGEGAAAAKLPFRGKIDLDEMNKDWRKTDVTIGVEPSANIEISGTLKINAYFLCTGLKVSGLAHTATGSDVTLKLSNEGKKFNLKVDLPKSKQELFLFKHNVELVVEKNGVETAVTIGTRRPPQMPDSCFMQLKRETGITLCFRSPNLDKPGQALNYPVEFAVYLDSHEHFTLEGEHETEDTFNRYTLTFDTPGSQENRKSVMIVEVTTKPSDFSARFKFDSSFKNIDTKFGFRNVANDLGIYGYYKNDRVDKKFNLGFEKTFENDRNVYVPSVYVEADRKREDNVFGYSASGKIYGVTNDQNSDYEFANFKISGPENKEVTFNGFISYRGQPITFEARSLKIETSTDTHHIDTKFTYDANHILYDGKVRNENNYKLNSHFVLERTTNDTGASHRFMAAFGQDFRQKYEYTNSYIVDRTSSLKVSFTNSLIVDPLDLNVKLGGGFSQNNLAYDFEARLKKKYRVASSLSLVHNAKNVGDVDCDLTVVLNRHSTNFKGKIIAENTRKRLDYRLTSNFGVEATLNGYVGDKYRLEEGDADLQGTFRWNDQDRNAPYSWTFKFAGKPETLSNTATLVKGDTQLASYNFDMKRSQPYSGTLDLYIKDLFKADGKFSEQDGNGNMNVLLDFSRLNKKVKLDTTYLMSKTQYDVDVKMFTDYGVDDNKQIHFTTKNGFGENNFNSKTTLVVNGETYAAESSGDHTGNMYQGDLQGQFTFTIPNGRTFKGDVVRKLTESNGVSSGYGKINLYDIKPQGQGQRTITIDAKANEFNPTLYLYDVEHVFTFVDFDGKNFILSLHNKHLPNGHYKSFYTSANVRGHAFPQEATAVFDVSEYCEKHAVFSGRVNYGERLSGDFNGNYHVGNEEKQKPVTFEFRGNLNAPETELKTFTLDTSGSYLVNSKDSNKQYDGTFKVRETFGDKQVRFDIHGTGNDNKGTYDITYQFPEYEETRVKGSYLTETDKESSKYGVDVDYNYANRETFKVKADVTAVEEKSLAIHYVLESSKDDVKNVDMTWKMEKTGDTTYTTNSHLTYGDKKYSFNNVAVLTEDHSSFDLTVVYPDSTAQLSGSAQKLGDRHGRAKLNINNFVGFTFYGSAEVNLQDFENFFLKADVDSVSLKLNKLEFEVRTKSNADGKAVEFRAVEATKNILTGTAQYDITSTKSVTTIQGRGDIQLYDKPSSVNFKLMKSMYTEGDEGPGFSYRFDGSFGSKNVVSELSVRMKEFKIKLTACENRKPCTNFELAGVSSTQNKNRANEYKVLLLIDLRELGYPYEFELNSHTSRDEALFYHDFEVNFIADNNRKYKYVYNMKPNEANMEFHLPSRKIVVNALNQVPKEVFGHYESTLAVYLDKERNPSEVSKLSFVGDLTYEKEKRVSGVANWKFSHPTLSKDLSIGYNFDVNKDTQTARAAVDFDIFKSSDQKVEFNILYQNQVDEQYGFNITTEAVVKSQGLNFRYGLSGHSALSLKNKELSSAYSFTSATSDLHFESYMYASPTQCEMIFKGFNEEFFHLTGVYDTNSKVSSVQATMKLLGSQPVHLRGRVDGITAASVNLYREDQFFNVDMKGGVGKETSLSVYGNNRPLLVASLGFTKADVVASKYDIHENEIEKFLDEVQDKVKDESKMMVEEVKRRFNNVREAYKQQCDKIEMARVDFSGLTQSYEQHFDAIFQELSTDPYVKEFIEHVKKIISALNEAYKKVYAVFDDVYQKLYAVHSDLYKKVADAYEKNILPALENTLGSMFTFFTKLYVEMMKLSKHVFEHGVKVMENFREYIVKFVETFSDFVIKADEHIKRFTDAVSTEFKDICTLFDEYKSTLPGYTEWKAEFDQWAAQWTGWQQLSDAISNILRPVKEILPTDEFKKFIDNFDKYIRTKLTTESKDDVEELKSLYMSLVDAIRSLIVDFNIYDPTSIQSYLPVELPSYWNVFNSLPTWVPGKLSWLNALHRDELEALNQYFVSKFQFDILPPFGMRGHIADGQNVFTFDGRNYAFPGVCSYVLAQDFKHGNFSIIATLDSGKLKSVTVVDKENMVEIQKDGVVKLNERNADLPIHKDNIHAWRRYYTVSILSGYGVRVTCTLDMKVCHFKVNGFYLGRVRGLLGNGNQEPFDDYILPGGRITENPVDLGNAYSFRSCKPVQFVDHGAHETSPFCKEFFGAHSLLALGYLFIDPQPYMDACNHAVTGVENQLDAACNIALTYVSAGRLENLPLQLPLKCAKCGEHQVGDEFEVTPTNKADFVFVVDKSTMQQSPNLLKRLMDTLRTKLKERNVVDTKFVVIGYHENEVYPSLFTSNGKLDSNGNISLPYAKGPEKTYLKKLVMTNTAYSHFEEYVNKFIEVLNKTYVEVQGSADANAFDLAMAYPFRADAFKTIIAIRNSALEYPYSWRMLQAAITNQVVKLKGISLHYIGPVTEVEPIKVKNLVGFNSKSVITMQDGAKRTSLGSPQLRAQLKYKSDMGIDIVQNNDGYVFSLTRLNELDKPKQRTFFTNAVSNSIADFTARTQAVYKCSCLVSYGLHPEPFCVARDVRTV